MGKRFKIKILFWIYTVIVFYSFPVMSKEANKNSAFIFLPMTGWISNEVEFTMPDNLSKQTIRDDGQLQGIYMIYAAPRLVLGSSGHYSRLDKSYENGYLFFTRYYFRKEKKIQPMLGLAIEYIHFYTQLNNKYISPLHSLDVDTSIWAFHPTIGISYKNSNFRVSPFAGYFNEQVNTIVTSPGMEIAGQNHYGFTSKSSADLYYISLGSKFEIYLHRLVKLDTNLYFRFRQNEKSLYTLRNLQTFSNYQNTKKLN